MLIPWSIRIRFLAVGFVAGVLVRSIVFFVRSESAYKEFSWFSSPVSFFLLVLCVTGLVVDAWTSRQRRIVYIGMGILLGVIRFDFGITPLPVFLPRPQQFFGVVVSTPTQDRFGVSFLLHDRSDGWNVTVQGSNDASVKRGMTASVYCRLRPVISNSQARLRGPYALEFRSLEEHVKGTCRATTLTVAGMPSRWSRIRSIPEQVRDTLAGSAGQYLSPVAAGLLKGTVLGVDSSTNASITESFQRTGTLHLLVVSGSHFSLLAGFLLALGSMVGMSRSFLLPAIVGMLFFFLAMIGFPPSAVRGFLASLSIYAAEVAVRPRKALHILFLITAAMLIADPWLALFTIGFQLSVLASAGIIVFSQPLDDALAIRFRWERFMSLRSIAASSIAAIFATTPLLLWAFGSVSLIAPIANVVALLVSPLLLVAGILYLASANLFMPFATLMAPLVDFLFRWFGELIHAFADIPYASITVGAIPAPIIILYYVSFLFICWRMAFVSDNFSR